MTIVATPSALVHSVAPISKPTGAPEVAQPHGLRGLLSIFSVRARRRERASSCTQVASTITTTTTTLETASESVKTLPKCSSADANTLRSSTKGWGHIFTRRLTALEHPDGDISVCDDDSCLLISPGCGRLMPDTQAVCLNCRCLFFTSLITHVDASYCSLDCRSSFKLTHQLHRAFDSCLGSLSYKRAESDDGDDEDTSCYVPEESNDERGIVALWVN